MKRFKFTPPPLLIFFSSILYVAAFPPWGFSVLASVALVPWLWRLEDTRTFKDALKDALWLNFLITIMGFFWVAYVLKEFGSLPLWVAIIGLFVFGTFNQIQLLVFGPIRIHLRKKMGNSNTLPLVQILIFTLTSTLLYTGIDALIPKLFVDTLGHSQYNARNLRMLADLGGAPLITFVLFFLNETILHFFRHYRAFKTNPNSKNSILMLVGLSLFFCVSGTLYGRYANSKLNSLMATPKSTLQAAVIQANIGDFEKVAAEKDFTIAAKKILKTFYDMSSQALNHSPKPDVLIWPETAYPTTFRSPEFDIERELDATLENFVKKSNTNLFFGGYDQMGQAGFNSLFFLSPFPQWEGLSKNRVFGKPLSNVESSDLRVYHKSILLLFGETIPGAETFPFIKTLFPQVGNFGRGPGPTLYTVKRNPLDNEPFKFFPMICYEALFSSFGIDGANLGADLILNITNDSWFGPYGEPQLHLALTAFRSIETHLPQIRSTNTGITALILPNGEITYPSTIGKAEILHYSVPLIQNNHKTLLQTLGGNWFSLLSLALGCLFLFWIELRAKKSKPVF